MSVTFTDAVAEVARRAGEFLTGTATAGSTTTLADTNGPDFQASDNYWDECVLEMVSGTANNLGVRRRVSAFVSSSAQLTMYGSFPAAVAAADGYRLYRHFTPVDYERAINRAVNSSWPDFGDTVRKTVSTVRDTLQYAVPTGPDIGNRGLIGLEYEFHTDAARATWPWTRLDPARYRMFQASPAEGVAGEIVRTVQLYFNPDSDRELRFIFAAPLPQLQTTTDPIHLDPPEIEWLYTEAAANLWRFEASRVPTGQRDDANSQAARWAAEAEKVRMRVMPEKEQKPLRRPVFSTRIAGAWRG